MSDAIRVSPITPGTRDELAGVEEAIRAERGGEIPCLYQVLLNSPPIAAGWEQLLTAIRNRSSIPAGLREAMILRVAVINRASFEFAAHLPHARDAGISNAKIDAIGDLSRNGTEFSDDERLVLEVTDHLTDEVEIPDSTMERLRARFDDRKVVEVVATVSAYNMVSRFLVALNIVH